MKGGTGPNGPIPPPRCTTEMDENVEIFHCEDSESTCRLWGTLLRVKLMDDFFFPVPGNSNQSYVLII